MKKIAILLTLVMVLGLGASAMAAEITTTGKVWVNYTKNSENESAVWENGERMQFAIKLDDNSGMLIRLEGNASAAPTIKRANYWVNFPGLAKVTAGLNNVNYSVLDQLDSNLSQTGAMIAVEPVLPEGFKAVGFLIPHNPDAAEDVSDEYRFGAEASYDFGVAKVYGGVNKAEVDDDPFLAIGGSVPVVKDMLTVYGEYNNWVEENDVMVEGEKILGAHLTAAGFDFYGEYALEAEKLMLEGYKTWKNVEFNVVYTAYEDDTNDFVVNTTMYF